MSFLAVSCSGLFGTDPSPTETITVVTFGKKNLSLAVGGSEYLTLTMKPSNLQNSASISWDYDASRIAIHPDSYGVVITGVAEGVTYIKATVNGITATCLITVTGIDGEYTGEPYIYAAAGVIELSPGETQTISVSLYGGQSYEFEEFSWSIRDPALADIHTSRNNCVITAREKGSTQITATHPKSEYPYTFILFIYTDVFSESYLSTADNVVTLNKSSGETKTVSVLVENPIGAVKQSGFRWEVITEGNGKPSVSVSANGETALLTPLTQGISLVRVTYEGSEYPLDILVRVTTTVQNVYIVPSVSTLIVTGSARSYTMYADLHIPPGYSAYPDLDAFVWTLPDDASLYMEYETVGNSLSVRGKRNGAVKVKITHELSEYSRSVLIVLSEQEESAVDSSMYITTSSNYVQTKVGGETVGITVTLAGGIAGDEQNLEWKIDNGIHNDVCLIETPHGNVSAKAAAGHFTNGTLYITPRKMGTATVTVSHPKVLYETEIVIKVYSEHALLEEPVYITSDMNVIRMLSGTTKEITSGLSGNFAQGDENGIIWESGNPTVIDLSPAHGTTTVASARGKGNNQTYITAKHEKAISEKRILVLSADTQEALDAMKGFYADTTYYRINEKGSAVISLTAFGLEAEDVARIAWDTDASDVCIVQGESGNRLNALVSGIKSGKAVVTASLPGSETARFNVTVLPEGEPITTILPKYLTTTKNALVLGEPGVSRSVQVTGVNISPESMAVQTSWNVEDPAIVSVSASGSVAAITALSYGKTKVIARNRDSSNEIVFDIKVGALYEWDDVSVPYITTENNVVTMVKGEKKTFAASLVNAANNNQFSFTLTGTPLAEVTGSQSGTCLIEALEAGITEITVRNPAAVTDKEILLVISNSGEELEGFPYLNTKQNVVTVGESFTAVASVTVVGAKTQTISGYTWASSDPSIVSVVDSGPTAVFYGNKTGTAKITVMNDACVYPLEIIVNCVNPVMAANNPYIAAPNIITLNVGDAATTVTASLVGGNEGDATAFTWRMANPAIASCLSSNDTAQLRALKEGVTQLIISHPKTSGIDRAILVIAEKKNAPDCYITTTESIIRMKPSDSPKTMSATLIGGKAEDAHAFKWWADSYDLIEMNYTGNQAVIKPLGAGSVTLHISHPKAAYQKDIIILISEYTEFAFETKSRTTQAGTKTFVNMRLPASQVQVKVSYASKTPSGADASSIVSASGTNAVCILDPHSEGTAVITANLVAVNSGAVLGTCELLVSITKAENPETFISFQEGTIITIEKGVTRTLKAALRGALALPDDSKALQWNSSDPSIIKLSPASLSGAAVNDEVQITALKAGAECTVTIRHEKAASQIILYCIIPGEAAASVSLDRSIVNLIEGDAPYTLSAKIANALENDYALLEWSVKQEQAATAVEISGSGKSVSIIPKVAGGAVITAKVPSSGRTSTCAVHVEKQRSIKFSVDSISTYPGETYRLTYKVEPPEETGSVSWTVSDSAYVQVVDNRNGTATIHGKYREGVAIITGTTASKATARLSVKNGWGNTFSLEKSLIKSIPVNAGDGTFDVAYEVKPACAELRVWGLSNMTLVPGTFDSFTDGVYTILPARHTSVNRETGVASGVIKFTPSGESKTAVIVQAWNPVAASTVDGTIAPAEVAVRQIQMDIYYNAYTFVPARASATGKYSRYDEPTGGFILGDGERLSFNVVSKEKNGTPQIESVQFEPHTAEPIGADGIKQHTLITSSAGSSGGFILTHGRDYGPESGVYYGLANAGDWVTEQYNTAVRAIPLSGMVLVRYRLYGSSAIHEYRFPLYVEIRNSPKTH